MTSWVFQGNPKYFDVDKYLRTRHIITWSIRQHRGEIQTGDEVYIWRSDGNDPGSGGVVAKGTILADPQPLKEDAPELWYEDQMRDDDLKVQIRLEDVRLSEQAGMLKRVDLIGDPVLKRMSVITFAPATNYKLTDEQAQRLRFLWAQRKR